MFNYKTQIAFGGLATPPGKFSGALVKKQLHFWCLRHVSASSSRLNISPMGVPQRARRTSCRPVDPVSQIWVSWSRIYLNRGYGRYRSSVEGHASKTLASPPTAAKCFSHNHSTLSRVPSTPAHSLPSSVPLLRSSKLASLCHFTNPERTSRMSPVRNSVPWDAATASRSVCEMAWRVVGS